MTRKTKLIISITLIGLLAAVSSALAATRTPWPDTPTGYSFPDEGIPELIRYFYEWAIALGGLLVFVALLIAGFQYMSSTGNPAMMQEAKDRIKSAFIGLALLLGSWLILNTVNPQLTRFPELVLDLARVAETTTSTYTERSAFPCEWGYVFEEEEYVGVGGYIEPGDTADESHPGDYCFDNNRDGNKNCNIPGDVRIEEPKSVQVWREINCFGYPNHDEESHAKDELFLPINQAIKTCENEKLALMTPAQLATGTPPTCNEAEILALVEADLIAKYGGEGGSQFVVANDPVRGPATTCPAYNVTSTPFNINYTITPTKYFLSDGNCTFQLSVGSLPGGIGACGDRVSEIYGTYPRVEDYFDRDIECVTLVANPRGKLP
jgi:hypothetical protein